MSDFMRLITRFPKKKDQRTRLAPYMRETKEMREHLTETQIDKTLKDTFPASDPPAWY
jgi:hypothetical protein